MVASIFSRMRANAYLEIDMRILDSTGKAVNLTSVDQVDWVLANDEYSDALVRKSSLTGSGILMTDPSNGICTVVISGVDTATLGDDTYFQQATYRMYGQTVPIYKGTIKIDPVVL